MSCLLTPLLYPCPTLPSLPPPFLPFSLSLYKVLEVFSELFIHIFDELNCNCKEELEAVRAQHPFKDLRYARPTLRLTFQEGIQLLIDAGYDGECVAVAATAVAVAAVIAVSARVVVKNRGGLLLLLSCVPMMNDIYLRRHQVWWTLMYEVPHILSN